MPTQLAKVNLLLERFLQRLLNVENALPPTEHSGLKALGDKYGFVVISDASVHDQHLCFDGITEPQKSSFADLLTHELGLYSKEVVQACGLKRVILTQNLSANGRPLAGMAEMGLWLVGSLVLNATILNREGAFRGQTIHHELFHAIDYRDDLSHYVDTDWYHLNAPGFRYNSDLAFVDMPPFDDRNIETPDPGFISPYSMQNPYEDKATLYAALIVQYRAVMTRTADDEVLSRKVEYMKKLLKNFHPYLDDNFWAKRDAKF